MPANTETNAEDRLQAIRQWATAAVFAAEAEIETSDAAQVGWQPVSGDASFRRYFRIQLRERSYIVMDAPPPQEQLAPFIDIAQRLRSADVLAPQIFAQDLQQGFLLLEDFGDQMVKSLLQADRGQPLFDRVLPLLNAMAACDTDGLPDYSPASLQRELDLFPDWYLARHRSVTLSPAQQDQWSALCKLLLANAAEQPQVFVHRDFHSCNLHVLSDDANTGVIDFQDAVRGPLTYDLASWLWDRYISWPRDELLQWMEQARAVLAPAIETGRWVRWCDLMGLQRNLKIVGIFARLYYRDGKSGYLELIPQFAAYILAVLPHYPELDDYRALLESQLSAAIEADR